MVAVEEIGGLDKAAGILRNGIGRVAVGPVAVHDRHVAKGEGEPFRRQFVRGAGDLHIGAGDRGERGKVDGSQCAQAVGHMGGDLRLARRAFIAEPMLERGARASVDAKAAGAFGRIDQHRFGHGGKGRFGAGVRAGCKGVGSAGGQRSQGEGGGTSDEEIAASGSHASAPG